MDLNNQAPPIYSKKDHYRSCVPKHIIDWMKNQRKAGKTYQEIADACGISRQRAHQLVTGRLPRGIPKKKWAGKRGSGSIKLTKAQLKELREQFDGRSASYPDVFWYIKTNFGISYSDPSSVRLVFVRNKIRLYRKKASRSQKPVGTLSVEVGRVYHINGSNYELKLNKSGTPCFIPVDMDPQ